MKAFKLASGFAVSALSLAIAGAAVAEATTEVEFTGSVRVQTVLDLEAETRASQLPGYGEGNGDWYHLDIETTVNHGPFSGKVLVGVKADDDVVGAMNGTVRVEDLRVDEGPISFGQIGSIADTVGKLEGLTGFDRAGETPLDGGVGVTAAFRYTLEEFGVKIQGEGADAEDWGIAAAVHQDLDVAEVWADFQYREPVGGDSDVDAVTAFGVAVEASPVDLIKIEAAFRSHSDYIDDGDEVDADSAWAAKVTVNATDDISVFGQIASISTENERMAIRGGATASFAPITVEGWYAMDLTDGAEDSGLLFAKVSYEEGAISAFGETKVGLNDNEGMMFKIGAKYTTESGIAYGAEYLNENEDWTGVDEDTGDANPAVSKFTAFAQYSF